MNKHNIFPGIHYRQAVHQQDSLNIKKSDLSNTEHTVKNIVSLPLYPGLSSEAVEKVCQLSNQYLEIL